MSGLLSLDFPSLTCFKTENLHKTTATPLLCTLFMTLRKKIILASTLTFPTENQTQSPLFIPLPTRIYKYKSNIICNKVDFHMN